MAHIKEPKGIDFIIQSEPLNDGARQERSNFIKAYKSKLQVGYQDHSMSGRNLMYKIIIGLLVFILAWDTTGSAWGQGRKPAKSADRFSSKIDSRYNIDCFHRLKYTAQQRRSAYPFSMAAEVKLISFECFGSGNDNRLLSIEHDSFTHSEFIEALSLSNVQSDSLTDILYNQGTGLKRQYFRGKPLVTVIGDPNCYIPRMAYYFSTLLERHLHISSFALNAAVTD